MIEVSWSYNVNFGLAGCIKTTSVFELSTLLRLLPEFFALTWKWSILVKGELNQWSEWRFLTPGVIHLLLKYFFNTADHNPNLSYVLSCLKLISPRYSFLYIPLYLIHLLTPYALPVHCPPVLSPFPSSTTLYFIPSLYYSPYIMFTTVSLDRTSVG